MTIARRPAPSLFSQVDVSSATHSNPVSTSRADQTELLREILTAQDRTNDLLEELGTSLAAAQKQRASELSQWRNAHPALAGAGRAAAEALPRVQIEYLERMKEGNKQTSHDKVERGVIFNQVVGRFRPRAAPPP